MDLLGQLVRTQLFLKEAVPLMGVEPSDQQQLFQDTPQLLHHAQQRRHLSLENSTVISFV